MPKSQTKIKKIEWKRWLHETSMQLGIMPDALRMKINRGQYPMPKLIREGRLKFVQLT